jgi:hypothetical protein
MAKAKINKSQKIREHLTKNPKATPKAVVDALKAEGVEVSSPLVSQVKSKGSGKSKGRKAGRKKAAAVATIQPGLTVTDLRNVKKVVDRLGGIKQARKALDVLQELG